MSFTSPSPVVTGTGAAEQGHPVLLKATSLTKSFGATRALRACSLELHAGEVLAILGENGSGKSTLVKVLAGVHQPDAGQIAIDGTTRVLRSPRAALRAGIVAVFQEVLVVEPRSVLENIWLGTDGTFRDSRSHPEKAQLAGAALGDLLASPPALDAPVEDLSLTERQACCLARALVRSPRILILDEATSALDLAIRDRLFAVLRRLSGEGTAVIFISHRMDEIQELSDRITVMRSGAVVATVKRTETDSAQLVHLLTGDEKLSGDAAQRLPRDPGAVVLRTEGLRLRADATHVPFELRAGELVGLAGLEGHGQDEFLRALAGEIVDAGQVVRVKPGFATQITTRREAASAGIVYVPRERRAHGLFSALSVRENFGLPTLAADRRLGTIRWTRTASRLNQYAERIGIRFARDSDPIDTLSGGNQQKIVIARWLAASPAVLLLNDPTRGVDIGAKRDIYRLLTELTRTGVAVVMLSTEVDEHVELMDRVLVFREHTLAAQLTRSELTREALVGSFFGPSARRAHREASDA